MQMQHAANSGSVASNHGNLNLSGIDQFLTFMLGEETYGIDILRVQEIKGWEATTQIPNMPSYVKGVINLRGVVIPIVDLRERFHMGNPTYDNSTVVIIVQVRSQDGSAKAVGIVVDGVSDVQDIDLSSLQPAPKFTQGGVDADYVKGLATLEGKMVIVLSVDDLVNDGLFAGV
jgi:purine-binding chemotaxis protein CheW